MASFPPSLHGHPRSPIEDTSVIFTCMSQKPCKMPSLLLVKSIGHRSCRADERVIDRRFICLKRAGVRATEGICSGSRSGVTRDARLWVALRRSGRAILAARIFMRIDAIGCNLPGFSFSRDRAIPASVNRVKTVGNWSFVTEKVMHINAEWSSSHCDSWQIQTDKTWFKPSNKILPHIIETITIFCKTKTGI